MNLKFPIVVLYYHSLGMLLIVSKILKYKNRDTGEIIEPYYLNLLKHKYPNINKHIQRREHNLVKHVPIILPKKALYHLSGCIVVLLQYK